MNVLLLGGSGFLGTVLSRQLREQGHDVNVVTRSPPNADRVRQTGARPLLGDFVNPGPELLAGIGQPDTMVLIAAPQLFGSRLSARRIRKLRREVDAIFGAALRLANTLEAPIVVTSGTSFRTRGRQVADESWPIERFGAARIGAGTDALITDAIARGQQVIWMLPGQIYGPGGMFKKMIDMARRGRSGYFGDGTNCIPRIHVEDCAQAYVRAVERAAELPPGTRYIVADDVACQARELSEEIARCLGLPPPKRISRAIAWLLLGELMHTVTANCRVTNAKLKGELGWRPRYPSFRDGVPATITALSRGGYLP